MISRQAIKLSFLVTTVVAGTAAGPRPEQETSPTRTQVEQLRRLIEPGPGESRWAQVPWMSSTDIWAARRKAAAEDKPLFLWIMAGEPLGMC